MKRHPFVPGPDALSCAVCGQPRFTTVKGRDPVHTHNPTYPGHRETEPTTAAGRATVEAFYQYTAVEDRDLVRDYILAIEAEARAAALDEAYEAVVSLRRHEPRTYWGAVLAAIDALRESGNPAKG